MLVLGKEGWSNILIFRVMKRFYGLSMFFIFSVFSFQVLQAKDEGVLVENSLWDYVFNDTDKDKDQVEAFAYDGFSGNDFGWFGSWFEYSVNNGNRVWNADFNGYNYAFSQGEVSLNYEHTASGISVKGGDVCVKAVNTGRGSQAAALSRRVANIEGSWKSPLQETFYVSFLAQFSEKPKRGWDYLAVGAKQSNYDAGVALGSILNKDKMGAAFAKDGSTQKYTSGKLPQANETYFVVGKFSTNSWGSVVAIDIYINPTSLDAEQAEWKASIKNSGYSNKNFYYYLSSIELMAYFHDVAYFDEIRLGASWKSVVSSLDNSSGANNSDPKVTVFEGPTGYWNEADKWSNGIPNAQVDTVVIKGQCAVDDEVEAKDVVVEGSGKLYIKKGGRINTQNPIVLKAVRELVAEYIQENDESTYMVEKEQYFTGGQWSFVCIPYDMTADELFPNLKLASSWSDADADYWLLDYSQDLRAKTRDGMKDIFDGDYVLHEGRGYIVWLDEDKLRTFEYESTKKQVSVSTSNSTATALSLNHAGWNLVGNPFSHTISYESVFDSSEHNQKYFNGAVYVWDGENYKVWSRGLGDEEAHEIGPLEAFFVKRTSDDPASAIFMINDDGETSSGGSVFSRSTGVSESPSSLAVSVNHMKGPLSDQTYINVIPNSLLGLDEDLDGLKLQTSSAYNDYIYSTDNSDVFAVNSVDLDDAYVEVPLVVNLAQGMDSILLGFTLDGDTSYSFALVDEDEMTIRPIGHGDYLVVASEYEPIIEGRFSIFITKKQVGETPIQTTPVVDDPWVKVVVDRHRVNVASLAEKDLSVFVIGIGGKMMGSDLLKARGELSRPLKSGIYLLRFSDGLESYVQKVVVP